MIGGAGEEGGPTARGLRQLYTCSEVVVHTEEEGVWALPSDWT